MKLDLLNQPQKSRAEFAVVRLKANHGLKIYNTAKQLINICIHQVASQKV